MIGLGIIQGMTFMKKSFFKPVGLVFVLLLLIASITACSSNEFTATFDAQGGGAIAEITVEDGQVLAEPTVPMKETVEGKTSSFLNWTTDSEGKNEYDFSKALESDITLYAQWTVSTVVNFDTRLGTIETVLVGENGGDVNPPAAPSRDGYRFGGWFTSKKGFTWLESAIEFPYNITESTTLYAYWEPLDSRSVDYSPEVTYTSTMDDSSTLNLNPLIYEMNHESRFINLLSTALYSSSSDSTEVDWEKAIADGIAEYPGDFSKFKSKEFSIEALDYKIILVGAAKFPMDSEGNEHLTAEGRYDREGAPAIKDTEWTISIREDLVFEDGKAITAADYEYTLKQFIDPVLNNFRATNFYKTVENKSGAPIINAFEYFTNGQITDADGNTKDAAWEDVGFEIIDDHTFKIKFFEPVSQSQAIGYSNSLRLIHKEAFEASLTAQKEDAAYGTPDYPYISYGEYIIKTWDENQKIVFNKNYDYVKRETINFKSRVIEIVDSVDTRMALFANGEISVAGLSQDYYAEYAEYENLFKEWDGFPQYLILNVAPSKNEENPHQHPTVMFDKIFRQALFYGFDRSYYANNVYAPNVASLLPIPLDTKAYNQDVNYYSESPQHMAVLEELNINPDTHGYVPDLALSLFDTAYTAWIAEGNEGPITLRFISENDDFVKNLVEHMKVSYEELFNAEEERLILEISYNENDANRVQVSSWNFDVALSGIGFGNSSGAHWQYPAIAFLGDWIGAGDLGLSQPNDESAVDGIAEYATKEIEVDLKNTWNYLEELGLDSMEEDELKGHIELYNWLKEAEGKEAGIFKGQIQDISLLILNEDVPWDGTASEPFAGASNDIYNYLAELEKVFFDQCTLIPTVTRSAATVFAKNVVIEWPSYSGAFKWGSGRYRYLSTDPDFMD